MKLHSTILLILLTSFQCLSQVNVSKISLDKNVLLIGNIERFDTSIHKYDTCDTGLGWKSICLIDGNIWFGCDSGMDLPRNELTKLIISINGNDIQLPVSGMYNPNIENKLNREQFKFKKLEVGYALYGIFSDGAGSYCAQWTIVKNKSIRNKISRDESDIIFIEKEF